MMCTKDVHMDFDLLFLLSWHDPTVEIVIIYQVSRYIDVCRSVFKGYK